MEKFCFEFKLKLVRAYLQGGRSFRFLGKKYGVNYSNIKRNLSGAGGYEQ